MKTHLDKEAKQQIAECLNLLKDILGQDLLGVYLYGSSIVGGLQKFSDIDLFVVSNRPTTHKDKAQLASKLLTISSTDQNKYQRPIELIIVVKSQINPWHYPPKFDFQYGEWKRKEFEAGNTEPWSNKVMSELALLITQVLLASRTLLSPNPNQLLDKVPYRDFMAATVEAVDDLMANLILDTRNVLLTFARIWSTVETDTIHSKPDAAVWAINRLPTEYQPVMQRALAICIGEEQENWDDIKDLIKPCTDFMVDKIKKQISILESSDYANRSIKLAK